MLDMNGFEERFGLASPKREWSIGEETVWASETKVSKTERTAHRRERKVQCCSAWILSTYPKIWQGKIKPSSQFGATLWFLGPKTTSSSCIWKTKR